MIKRLAWISRTFTAVLPVAVLFLTAMIFMSACAVEYIPASGEKPGNATSTAVTGKTAVSGKWSQFRNDDNFYVYDEEGEEEEQLLQCKWDGTIVDTVTFDEDFCYLCWVDNEWIYYSVSVYDDKKEADRTELWRVPIQKVESGDKVQWEKKEKLLTTDTYIQGDNFYVNDDYIVYQGNYGRKANFYKYDFKEKKEVPLGVKKEFEYSYFALDSDNYIAAADRGFAYIKKYINDDKKEMEIDEEISYIELYYLDIEKWEARKIYRSALDPFDVTIVAEDGTAFFTTDTDIWRFEKGDDKPTCLIDGEHLENKLSEINPWKNDGKKYSWRVTDLFSYGGRLCLSMKIEWNTEKSSASEYVPESGRSAKKSRDSVLGDMPWAYGYLMFSCNMNNAADLRYEKELSECVRTYSDQGKITTGGGGSMIAYYIESGTFKGVQGDDFFLELYDKAGSRWRYGCYDRKSGEFRYLNKKDEAYWHPYCVGWEFW